MGLMKPFWLGKERFLPHKFDNAIPLTQQHTLPLNPNHPSPMSKAT